MLSDTEKGPPPPPIALPILFTTLVIPYLISFLSPTLTPIVKISDGLIQGRVAYSRNGTKYFEFVGVPYAEPPLAELRFQPPIPVKSWNDVKQVTNNPSDCAQFESMASQRLIGVEDCLYINIATHPFNDSKNENLRPVMVNIPGGGFVFGGTSFYGPSYFMDDKDLNGIIVVTFNYRVGPLGFLNFAQTQEEYEENELPRGNMGLKDQLLALQWVQKNIIYFGGDPNQITLYGQSAGGVSAHHHLLSPKSQGLFHRVFFQSGSVLSPWAFTKSPKKLATNLAKKLGCPLENKKDLLKCLQSADPHEMASHQRCVLDPTIETDIFVTSLETVITNDTFLSEHPYNLLQNGNYPDIPIVFGISSGDGAIRVGRFDAMPEFIEIVEQNWSDLGGFVLGVPSNSLEKVGQFYFSGNTNFTKDPQSFKDGVAKICGDAGLFEGVHTSAKIHSRKGNGSVHLFLYDYMPTRVPGFYSYYKAVGNNDWLHPGFTIVYTFLKDWIEEHVLGTGKGSHQYGPAHAEEMLFLWNVDPITSRLFSDEDLEFSQKFVKVVTDFVKGKELSFNGVSWPQVKKGVNEDTQLQYMLIDENGEGKMIPEPFTERMKFWQTLGIRDF